MAAKRRRPGRTRMKLRSATLLDELIKLKGYNQTSLAETAGCSRQMIGNLVNEHETGCGQLLATRICLALDEPVVKLFIPDPPAPTTDGTAIVRARRPYRGRRRQSP